jgi:hypothetical protein
VTDARRDHLLFATVFVASRIVLYLLGFRLYFSVDWMFLADRADLTERLSESLVQFHAYPPLMNALTGVALKLGGSRAAGLLTIVYWGFGLVLASSLLGLLRTFGVGRRASFATALAFALVPPTLYLEHLHGDAMPCASLLMLAAVLLHRAVLRRTTGAWATFFATTALLALLRGTFHLSWVAAMLVLALAVSPAARRLEVLRGALGPVLLVLAVYLKNLALFGFFGVASQTSFLYHVTVRRLPAAERAAWVADGRLSPLAVLDIYGSPRQYQPYFVAPPRDLPPVLSDFERRSSGRPNYNHWFMLDASRLHRSDALAYVKARPREYARTVVKSLAQFFEPTTRWHPHDRTPRSPHHAHRALLGGWEQTFDAIVHRFPLRGVGLYLLLPLPLWFALRTVGILLQTRAREDQARAAVLAFAVFQIVAVALLSSLLSFTESSRYRFPVEAPIWFLAAVWLKELLPSLAKRVRSLTGFEKPNTLKAP